MSTCYSLDLLYAYGTWWNMNFEDCGKQGGLWLCSESLFWDNIRTFQRAHGLQAVICLLLYPLYSPVNTLCSNYIQLLAVIQVFSVLLYIKTFAQSFPHLNHLYLSSSGKLTLWLRTTKVTASVTHSQRRLTHLPPFPQCFADASSTAFTNYWLRDLGPVCMPQSYYSLRV